MSYIESQIIVNVPDDVDVKMLVEYIQQAITASNGKPTRVNIIEMDNPVAGGLINTAKEL